MNESNLTEKKGTLRAQKKRLLFLFLLLVVLLSSPLWGQGLWLSFFQNRAEQSLQARDPENALDWLGYARALDDENPRTEILLARAYRKSHDVEKAYEQLKNFYEQFGSTEESLLEQWLLKAQVGDNTDLKKHLSELLIQSQGDMQDICETFVNSCILNYQFNEALNLLKLWEADFPEDPLPNFMRGKILEHNRALQDAIKEFQKTLRKDPGYAPAAYNLARIQLTLKKTEAAMKYFQMTLENTTYQAPAKIGLARCYRLLNRNPEAKKLLNEVLQEDVDTLQEAYQVMGQPKFLAKSAAQLEMGNLELAEKNYEAALKWMEPAAKANPLDLGVKNSLAIVYSRLGRKEEAKELSRLIKETNDALGKIQEQLDQVLKEPHNAELRFQIGKSYLRYVSEEQGIVWLNSALRNQPDHGPAHAELARYYEQNRSRGKSFERLAKSHRQQADALQKETDSDSQNSDPQ